MIGGRTRRRRRGPTPVVPLAVLLAVMLWTAGCTQLLSINEDALVSGFGLDAGRRSGQVAVSLQWFHHGPASSSSAGAVVGGGPGGSGGGRLLTLGGEGPDVAAAVAAVRDQTDQNVALFSNNLLVLGEGLGRRGVAGPLNYLWRTTDFPETAQVAVARGRAAALLESPFPGGIALELGRRLRRSAWTDTGSIPIPFWRFLARMTSADEAAWAPIFAPTPQGFRADGTALFDGQRLAGAVDQGGTAALGWLLKRGGYGDLVLPGVPAAGDPVALHVRSRALRLAVDDAAHAVLHLTLQTDVSEGQGVLLQNHSPARLQAEAARQAQRDVRAVLNRLQAAGSDVLGLGERLRERDPAAVRDWPRQFRRMRIGLRVRVRIVSTGRGAA